MLADPGAGLRKPLTDLLFLRHRIAVGWGPALSSSVRFGTGKHGLPRLTGTDSWRPAVARPYVYGLELIRHGRRGRGWRGGAVPSSRHEANA